MQRRRLLVASVGSATITYAVLASPIACNLPAPPSGPDPDASPPNDAGDLYDVTYDTSYVQPLGNPLCGINADSCDPDDDHSIAFAMSPAKHCATGPDGGKGCRAATSTPACVDANPANRDGTQCEAGVDCAAGFDCVAADGGGVCRRYCCSGSCRFDLTADGGRAFCDIQQRPTGDKVPVCLPVNQCTLFVQGQCTGETCAVVDEYGHTGCVATGTAQEGESCDVEHCAAGLSCIALGPKRICYQTCQPNGPLGCTAPRKCSVPSGFKDPSIGLCEK